MPSKRIVGQVDLVISDVDSVIDGALDEATSAAVKRTWLQWVLGWDLKIKLLVLLVLGMTSYAIYNIIITGDLNEGWKSLMPLYEWILATIQGMFTE